MKFLQPLYYSYYIIKLLLGLILIAYSVFSIDFSLNISTLFLLIILYFGIRMTINSYKNLHNPNFKKLKKTILTYKKEKKLELYITLILIIFSLIVFIIKDIIYYPIVFITLIPVIAIQTFIFPISIFLKKLNLGFLTIFLNLLIIYFQVLYTNLFAKIISYIKNKIT